MNSSKLQQLITNPHTGQGRQTHTSTHTKTHKYVSHIHRQTGTSIEAQAEATRSWPKGQFRNASKGQAANTVDFPLPSFAPSPSPFSYSPVNKATAHNIYKRIKNASVDQIFKARTDAQLKVLSACGQNEEGGAA